MIGLACSIGAFFLAGINGVSCGTKSKATAIRLSLKVMFFMALHCKLAQEIEKDSWYRMMAPAIKRQMKISSVAEKP